MSGHLPDSPMMTRPYCPTCEEVTDPAGRELLEVRWCTVHQPARDGVEDEALPAALREMYPAGSGEAGGPDNRAWCAFFHRKQVLATGVV